MHFHSFLFFIILALVCSCKSDTQNSSTPVATTEKAPTTHSIPKNKIPPKPVELSIASTKTIEFMGKKFELKFKDSNDSVKMYEFFLAKDSLEKWTELVDLRVYSAIPEINKPMELAALVAKNFMKSYPQMKFALYAEDASDAAILDFFCPTSTYKEEGKTFLEFNSFKFYRDPSSNQIIGFHYAKNMEGMNPTRTLETVSAEIKNIRDESATAMTKIPLYRQ